MRKTITFSLSEEMYRYVMDQKGFGTVSEYLRSLVREHQQRREDEASRPVAAPRRLNQRLVFASALEQLDRLKALLEGNGAGEMH